MRLYHLVSAVVLSSILACAQSSYARHSFSLGSGTGLPLEDSSFTFGQSLDAGYTLRLLRCAALEAGYSAVHAEHHYYPKGTDYPDHAWIHFVHYGVRYILPLRSTRFQLSAGAGGGANWVPSYDGSSSLSTESMKLMQYSFQATYALDRAGHWRIGPTGRFYRNFGQFRQEWFLTSFGVGYNF